MTPHYAARTKIGLLLLMFAMGSGCGAPLFAASHIVVKSASKVAQAATRTYMFLTYDMADRAYRVSTVKNFVGSGIVTAAATAALVSNRETIANGLQAFWNFYYDQRLRFTNYKERRELAPLQNLISLEQLLAEEGDLQQDSPGEYAIIAGLKSALDAGKAERTRISAKGNARSPYEQQALEILNKHIPLNEQQLREAIYQAKFKVPFPRRDTIAARYTVQKNAIQTNRHRRLNDINEIRHWDMRTSFAIANALFISFWGCVLYYRFIVPLILRGGEALWNYWCDDCNAMITFLTTLRQRTVLQNLNKSKYSLLTATAAGYLIKKIVAG